MQRQEMGGERVVEERAEGNERYDMAGNERGDGSEERAEGNERYEAAGNGRGEGSEERAEGNKRYAAAGNGRGRVVKKERRETRGMKRQCHFAMSLTHCYTAAVFTSNKGGGTRFCLCSFVYVCLSVSKIAQKRVPPPLLEVKTTAV